MVIWLLQACTSLHSLQGAKTIEPETWEVALGASLQQNNTLSLATNLPVPQSVLSVRYGWKPHLDVGTQVYFGGGLIDVRYQFAQMGDWYFAVAPTIGGLYAGVYGNVDFRLPLRAQTDLNDKWSMTLGVTPMTQQTLIRVEPMQETLVNSHLGTTLRLERQGKRVRWGFTTDVVGNMGRAAPISLNYGMDMSWVRQRKEQTTQDD